MELNLKKQYASSYNPIPFCRFIADLTTRLEFMMFASMRLSFRRLCRLVGDLDVIAVSIAFVLP